MKNDCQIRILFLTADPTDTARLRLQQELRDIRERLQLAKERERFRIEYRPSARPGDIIQAIVDVEPDIVHFSGHSTSSGELCFENEFGETQPVQASALAALFELVADQVSCVFLNACYSEIQAKAIVKHIAFVIGMNQAIGDPAAIAFAVGFYTALGASRPIEEAFKFGCADIQLKGISEYSTPVLHKKKDKRSAGIYVERPRIEERCYEEIIQPGALIRIKAPNKMGKTSLMNRILTYARGHNYQTATLCFRELVDSTVLVDLEKFLQSFCVAVGNELGLPNKLNEYWDNQATPIYNSKIYFQQYLLANRTSPLVLALNHVDLVFEQPLIAQDFCTMLRTWHELAKSGNSIGMIWEKLRLIIVHSTEVYASLDINSSPLANVGLPIDLPEFSLKQVRNLVKRHGLRWNRNQSEQLMEMLGGHPFLLRTACDYFRLHEITFENFLEIAPTPAGPFSDHLLELLEILNKNSELKTKFRKVVRADSPVQLEPAFARSLQRLGLVKLEGYSAKPRCKLYRDYFRFYLGNNK
ncbi:AAA-like domain-containing protein [Brasilonema sp. UFV-L1]|uniref:AAA-like domain-containing protein n=1 Tax=Brasilonema sp. UFV-L1 TaxID=2234130 RepID=UPI00145E0D11|nr:AAA-like domain-containing protein [Brasilonema sp. UFV-L1]NMG11334.1 adenylate cyclase [Brasilonema sp. UFV-L1]